MAAGASFPAAGRAGAAAPSSREGGVNDQPRSGHLEKLISLPIADCPGVNVYESEREQTGIIR
jgi:hypothetical protein